jgi:hypothetical protein
MTFRGAEDVFPPGPEGFPLPDWNAIADRVEAEIPAEDWHRVYGDLGAAWMERVREVLGGRYAIRESRNFILLSTVTEEKAGEVLRFLERIDARIQQTIPALLPEELYGKCPVIAFGDEQDFYRYVSQYIPEDGDFGGMGGVYLNRGYGHFAMPNGDLERYVSVMSHELCHAFLHHLVLPLWLDEAITQGVEHSITGLLPYMLDREMIGRHQDYWDAPRIRAFWSGASFGFADEGQELSYHLARFILHGLHDGGATPRGVLDEFFLRAKYDDAGQSAALEVLGISLGECLVPLLGEGDWEPPEPAEDPGAPAA